MALVDNQSNSLQQITYWVSIDRSTMAAATRSLSSSSTANGEESSYSTKLRGLPTSQSLITAHDSSSERRKVGCCWMNRTRYCLRRINCKNVGGCRIALDVDPFFSGHK